MNVQIDLMFDGERRSGSAVRRRFVVRLAMVIVPVITLGLLAALFAASRAARHDLHFAEQEKKRTDPEHKKVVRMEMEYNNLNALQTALHSWSRTRLDAGRLLRGLQTAAPPSIQLTQFVFNEKLDASGRTAGIFLNGKVVGQYPDADVQRLLHSLKSNRPFPDVMELVEVKRFAASETLEDRGARVFEIECRLKPRLLGTPSVPGPKNR